MPTPESQFDIPLAALRGLRSVDPDMSLDHALHCIIWAWSHGAFEAVPAITSPRGSAAAGPLPDGQDHLICEDAPVGYHGPVTDPVKGIAQSAAPDRAGEPWTPDEEAELVRRVVRDGQTAVQASVAMGRPVEAARNKLARLRAKAKAASKPAPNLGGLKSLKQAAPAPAEPVSAATPDAPRRAITAEALLAGERPSDTDAGDPEKGMAAHVALLRPDHTFDAAADEYLVRATLDGVSPQLICDQLGCDLSELKARWQLLQVPGVTLIDGKRDADGCQLLLDMLERRTNLLAA